MFSKVGLMVELQGYQKLTSWNMIKIRYLPQYFSYDFYVPCIKLEIMKYNGKIKSHRPFVLTFLRSGCSVFFRGFFWSRYMYCTSISYMVTSFYWHYWYLTQTHQVNPLKTVGEIYKQVQRHTTRHPEKLKVLIL